MNFETVMINLPVRRQTLRDLLCTAVEGGSNYWATFSNAEQTESLDYIKVKVTENESSREGTPRVNRYITADDLASGLSRLGQAAANDDGTFQAAGKHLADALGDHDATTADVVLQMTIFGELIYG